MESGAARQGSEKPTLTGVEWINDLNKALMATRCRVGRRKVRVQEGMDAVAGLLAQTRQSGNAVWWVGKGGSAALCAHLSQDALNKPGCAP